MIVIFCIINGIIPVRVCKKINNVGELLNKLLYVKSVLFNVLLTGFSYIYYIGYRREELAALLSLTRNSIYFICMSLFWGAVFGIILLKTENIKNSIENAKSAVLYNITSLDRLMFYVILVISAVTRILGYDWGAGMTFHPDESEVTHYPSIMAQNNTLLSGGVYYPAQISGKILTVLYEVYGLLAKCFGWTYSDLVCNHIARILIALFSVGTVVCIYYIGNHLKKHAGTIAAMIAAVFPPFVQMAHCVTGDPIVGFFACLCIICAFYYYAEEKGGKWLVAMAILTAMAGLEKYNGLAMCGFIAVVVISKAIQGKQVDFIKIIKDGVIAVFGVAASIVLIAPNLVVHYQSVIEGILYVTYGFEEDGSNTFIQSFYQYMMEFTSYAGVLCLIMLLLGLVFLMKTWKKEYCIFSMGLIIMIAMCLQNRVCLRWGYIFYTCFIIIIGIAIVMLYNYSVEKRNMILKTALGVIVILILANNTAGTMLIDTVYASSGQDTRVASGEWCEEQGIAPLDCIYDNYTCFNPGSIAKNPVEWITIQERLEKIDGGYYINTLGRKYAVANISRNGMRDYLMGLEEVASFWTGCAFNGFSVDLYHNFSKNIYEANNIVKSLKLVKGIWEKQIYFGYDTVIYDISSLPAFQKFPKDVFENRNEEHGMQKLSAEIVSISEGQYSLQISSDVNGSAYLEDEQDNIICQFEVKNGYAEFEVEQQFYHTNIILMMDEPFEEMVIATM